MKFFNFLLIFSAPWYIILSGENPKTERVCSWNKDKTHYKCEYKEVKPKRSCSWNDDKTHYQCK